MDLRKKIEELFQELDFEKINVNGISLFSQGGSYYRVTFVEGLNSYVIEYSNSYNEAINNVFEDGDLYPISMCEDELIDKLRDDLVNYYIN